MGFAVTVDQRCSASTGTPLPDAFCHCIDDLRVVCQTQVIVAAEGEQSPSVNPHHRLLRRLADPSLAKLVIDAPLCQPGPQRFFQ